MIFIAINVINAIKDNKNKFIVAKNVMIIGFTIIQIGFTVLNAINAIKENKKKSFVAINVINNG